MRYSYDIAKSKYRESSDDDFESEKEMIRPLSRRRKADTAKTGPPVPSEPGPSNWHAQDPDSDKEFSPSPSAALNREFAHDIIDESPFENILVPTEIERDCTFDPNWLAYYPNTAPTLGLPDTDNSKEILVHLYDFRLYGRASTERKLDELNHDSPIAATPVTNYYLRIQRPVLPLDEEGYSRRTATESVSLDLPPEDYPRGFGVVTLHHFENAWKKHLKDDEAYYSLLRKSLDLGPGNGLDNYITKFVEVDNKLKIDSLSIELPGIFVPPIGSERFFKCYARCKSKKISMYICAKEYRRAVELGEDVPTLFFDTFRNCDWRPLARNARKEPKIETLPDTFNMPETEPAPGFGLKLRDYQKRSLSWLLDLESDKAKRVFGYQTRDLPEEEMKAYKERGFIAVQLGPGGAYWDPINRRPLLYEPSKFCPIKDVKMTCNGAILADDTGTGKTVTTLALIHSRPMRSIREMEWNVDLASKLLVSRATLVICPSHLTKQWYGEAKRCMPKARIYLVCTIIDHRKISWNDVLMADIVIVSIAFLLNANYKKFKSTIPDIPSYGACLVRAGRKKFGEEKGQFILDCIYWHRIVCDEFHELHSSLGDKSAKAARAFLNGVHARFYLGVTGTPMYDTLEEIEQMAAYLETTVPPTPEATVAFLKHCVRRNEPNLGLPPLIQDLQWIDMSATERGLYETLRAHPREALMACNHHQLADGILNMVGENQEMTINEVASLVQVKRQRAIANYVANLADEQAALVVANSEYAVMLRNGKTKQSNMEKKLMSIKNLMLKIQSTERALSETRAQYTFFQAVLDAVAKVEEQSCLICLETMEEGDTITIARCGHIHCVECCNSLLNQRDPLCSMCRLPLSRDDVARVPLLKPRGDSASVKGKEKANNGVDCSKYGSKLAAFVDYMNQEVEHNPDAKFILFIQFKRLMHLVSNALTEFKIKNVVCDGTVYQRQNAIADFKTSDSVRLILLSSESSVSGLHLVNATHVVILHPFLRDTDESALAYEKQGIARAWRSGQTKRVKVVRFLVRDSIEEQLAEMRNYQPGEFRL